MSGSRSHRSFVPRRFAIAAAACLSALVPVTPALAQPADVGPVHHAVAAHSTVSHVLVGRSPVLPPTPAAYGGSTQATDSVPRTDFRSPDARDAAIAASATPASRPDPRSPDARDAGQPRPVGTSVPADLPTVVIHDNPSALPLVLSIAALLIALAGWGFVATRKSATRRPVPGLSH